MKLAIAVDSGVACYVTQGILSFYFVTYHAIPLAEHAHAAAWLWGIYGTLLSLPYYRAPRYLFCAVMGVHYLVAAFLAVIVAKEPFASLQDAATFALWLIMFFSGQAVMWWIFYRTPVEHRATA
jgi:predicted ABC-type sugar transport system permease subunit